MFHSVTLFGQVLFLLLSTKFWSSRKVFFRIATYSKSSISSVPLFLKLKICTIYGIKIYHICFLFTGYIPKRFKTKINWQVHSYSTRQSSDLPQFLTCRGQFSIGFRGIKLCNDFSHLTKIYSSTKCYKRCFKDCLTAVQ